MITLKDDSKKGIRTKEYPLNFIIFEGNIVPEITMVKSFAHNFNDPVPRIESISSKGKLIVKWS